MAHWQGLVGLVAIPLLVLAFSEDRRAALGRDTAAFVAGALLLQLAIAFILLNAPGSRFVFEAAGGLVAAIQAATDAGAQMVFGYLAGGPVPFDMSRPEFGYVLGFRMLPVILVMAALMRLFFHWGILQRIVAAFAFVLRRFVGISGPLATVSSASVFLGPVEAPLLIRPYVDHMGRGALFATMTVGMATVAGTVLALYASILAPQIPDAAGHLLAASIMNVPAALLLARIAVPESFSNPRDDGLPVVERDTRSSMDAVVRGTFEGLSIAASVGALLIVAVALVSLVNAALAVLGGPFGMTPTLQGMLGAAGAPLAWMIGIPWAEAGTAGALLGQKLVLNEFLAYLELAKVPAEQLSERSRLILMYALCSFANLGSLGIMIGGLTAMVPARRDDILALAPKAVSVGYFATLLSGAIIGLIAW